ncbi:hypothetical protein JCM10212_003006 [Sporobolomyces blumeae]
MLPPVSSRPSSIPRWNPSVAEQTTYRHPRPLNSVSSRPLSVASTVSAASSSSSITGDRRRRSQILLELELGLDPHDDSPSKRSIRNSILRAEEVLRASEHQRELERRRDRAGLRSRQVTRSALVVDHLVDDTTEELDCDAVDASSARRFSPRRFLRKARSIPVDLLVSPSSRSPESRVVRDPAPERERELVSPPFPSNRPRRPASAANLLIPVPQPPSILSPPRASAPMRPRYDTLPTRLDPLPLPLVEPTSKFSASSNDSIRIAQFGTSRPLRFKDRARTFSQASTNGFRSIGGKMKLKTPSKLALRRKPSLAGIFRDVNDDDDDTPKSSLEGYSEARDSRSSSGHVHTLGHRPNASVSSSAPSTDADSKRKATSRLGFFRNPLRESTNSSSSGSRVSPSIISRPLSVSTNSNHSTDKRLSDVVSSSEHSSGSKDSKFGGWASRIGKTIKGRGRNVAAKRALFESNARDETAEPVLQLAEKVKVDSSSPRSATIRPPSRLPVSALFSNRPSSAAPARPRRPSNGLISSDDTTFHGHRVPQVRAKAAVLEAIAQLQSSAPRVRAKTSVPSASSGRLRSRQESDSYESPTVGLPRSPVDPAPTTVSLLPAADILPAQSLPCRKLTLETFEADLFGPLSSTSNRPQSLSPPPASSDEEGPRSISPSRSFRSPSPARFRDLLPSGTASSPDRNERGLPIANDASPRSDKSAGSPKKCAMGPEQIICMSDARERTGPISEVRGATTDLADLLSGLEETREYDRSQDLFPSPEEAPPLPPLVAHPLPHYDSMDSLRSTVSDVPHDLKELISVVDDHISEVDIPSFAFEGDGMVDRGFADEGFHPSSDSDSSSDDDTSEIEHLAGAFAPPGGFLSVARELETVGFNSDGATSTLGFDYTASSFEGHVSTAASVLQEMLAGSIPLKLAPSPLPVLGDVPEGEANYSDEEPEDATDPRGEQGSLRDSAREALEVGRPSAGDRMFDRVDCEVSLAALVDGPSLPPSLENDRHRPSIVAASFARGHFRHDSVLSSTDGSSESTGFSIASPTPLPTSNRPARQSLARYSQDRHPLHRPSHRARPVSDHSSGSSGHEHSQEDPTTLSFAQSSRSTNLSISSITSSPCPAPRSRRVPMLTGQGRRPLQPSFRFPPDPDAAATVKAKPLVAVRRPLPMLEDVAENEPFRGTKTSTSPRFVRPLKPDRAGEPIPQPRLLELEDLDELVPPDTPPSSSPSTADEERRSLSRTSERSREGFGRPSHRQHRRHPSSASSSILQSVIVEKNETSPRRSHHETTGHDLGPLSPIAEPPSPLPSATLQRFEVPSSTAYTVEPKDLDEAYADVLASDEEDDYDFTAANDPEVTRKYVHLTYEAETEIHRSQTIWPDTDASREALALFDAPKTYYAILDFLFNSQNQFPSPPQLFRLPSFVPVAFADPPTPPSPIVIPAPLEDDEHGNELMTIAPPSPEPVVVVALSPLRPKKPVRPARNPLRAKSVNVNPQVAALSQSTKQEETLSPFTALPPRLGTKLRGLRSQMSPTKKRVDTAFLGDAASRRRQRQFNAAARMLEGTGRPSEQRSDEDTDDTGVLEARGEATDEFTLSKTPRLSTSRPRVRPKTVISTLR